ncbi:MAG: 50S ribosomal protein L31 [Chloroflexi bacterium]|nr:50S ribosomal protein L31 [Chloroflexota bacterium]
MKAGIHPKYFPTAKVICSCGNTWTTGSTREVIHTDVCYKCHPFYTGEQRIVDTEGQVDRFVKKLDARAQMRQQEETRKAARMSPTVMITELNLGARAEAALAKAEITTVGQILERLQQGGDEALLSVEGFGRKSLADTKKRLRSRGIDIPGEGEQTSAESAAEA